MGFKKELFQYFDAAKRNRKNRAWFEKNQDFYEEAVKEPFSELLEYIDFRLGKHLPGIVISPRRITRPLRPKSQPDAKGGWVKTVSYITLWEKKTSLFEWNPGVHIQFGADPEDNLMALGLYMVSSRQMHLMRANLVDDYKSIHKILSEPKLKKAWGGMTGERFKRFPRNFDVDSPSAEYLWHKQFYLNQQLSRKEVLSPKFFDKAVKDLEIAIPYFQWVRETVGTYQRTTGKSSKSSREDLMDLGF